MNDVTDVPVEVEAKALGWAPQEDFKGDPERWVDAETFVRRGHEVMPILRKNNQELMGKLTAEQAARRQAETRISELASSVETLKEFQASEVKRQVDQRLKDLRAEKTTAIKEGDHELAAVLDEKIDLEKERKATVAAAPASAAAPPPPAVEPWAAEFAASNSEWLHKDKRKTAYFAAVADELFATGLRGAPLLAKAKEEMEGFFSPKPRVDKVESGAPPASGGKGEPTFASLPADAKQACLEQAKKMVGPGKPFKDEAGWKKHYATVYLGS